MQITNSEGNAVFDSSDSRCGLWLAQSGRELYAFIQVLDIGGAGCRHPEPFQKRYWGPYSHDNPESSIRWIMDRGGKWPDLPGV